MQLGCSCLSPEERERRFRLQFCLYCGESGHRVASCLLKGTGQEVTAEQVPQRSYYLLFLHPGPDALWLSIRPGNAFIDSGSDTNHILAKKLNFNLRLSLCKSILLITFFSIEFC